MRGAETELSKGSLLSYNISLFYRSDLGLVLRRGVAAWPEVAAGKRAQVFTVVSSYAKNIRDHHLLPCLSVFSNSQDVSKTLSSNDTFELSAKTDVHFNRRLGPRGKLL